MYEDPEMCHSLRRLKVESVQPQMKMSDITYVKMFLYKTVFPIFNFQ